MLEPPDVIITALEPPYLITALEALEQAIKGLHDLLPLLGAVTRLVQEDMHLHTKISNIKAACTQGDLHNCL